MIEKRDKEERSKQTSGGISGYRRLSLSPPRPDAPPEAGASRGGGLGQTFDRTMLLPFDLTPLVFSCEMPLS